MRGQRGPSSWAKRLGSLWRHELVSPRQPHFPASLVQYVRLARAITVLGCVGPNIRSVRGSRTLY
jgi:hypothetical protein